MVTFKSLLTFSYCKIIIDAQPDESLLVRMKIVIMKSSFINHTVSLVHSHHSYLFERNF